MSEQANIAFIKECYDAYAKADAPRLLSYMAPDVDWTLPEMPGLAFAGKKKGRDGVQEFFRQVSEAQQLRQFEPKEFFANGDRVVVLGTHAWTVRSNGVDIAGDWVHIFTVKDGQITAFNQVLDTHEAMVAHGKPPDPSVARAWKGEMLQPVTQAPRV